MTSEADLKRDRLVQQYFRADAFFWKDVYAQSSLNGEIYRERRAGVLRLVDRLNLPSGARVLDVGCGAGTTSVAIAKRGLRVEAVDAAPEMVDLTRQAACASHTGDLVNARAGDVHKLGFAGETFDLAVAIGVMEWMPSFAGPLKELHRVLCPGGWLIANVDNSRALHCWIDPRMNPAAGPVKRYVRRLVERVGLLDPLARPSRCSRARFDEALRAAGFQKFAGVTCGFGPMTIIGKRLLPDKAGMVLHRALQKLADRQFPLVRNGGDAYLALVQKRGGKE